MTSPLGWVLIPLPVGVIGALAWVGCRYFYTPIRYRTKAAGSRPRPSKPKSSYRWYLVPVVLAFLTIAITLRFSNRLRLDPLSGRGIGPRTAVETRMNEEVLVPPPTLPPALFAGTERMGLEKADRDWGHLDAAFAQTILKLFVRMDSRGYRMALLEGYRSPERQEALASQGPTVTLAHAGQSRHQFGQAVDVAPLKDGRLVISQQDGWAQEAYRCLGEEAEALGLTWGGRWKLQDLGHVEVPAPPRRPPASPPES